MNDKTECIEKRDANAQTVGMRVQCGIRSGVGMPLGDAVQGFTHATGLDQLAEAYTNATGKDCGCAQRRELLNKLFPI
jgi:hypothetical protein